MTRRRHRIASICLLAVVAALAGGSNANAAFNVTEFPVPTSNGTPWGITLGSDGNLWFTEQNGDHVARITPGGTVTEFLTSTTGVNPNSITAGPDGNLWFTETEADAIGRVTPSGVVMEFPVPVTNARPDGITAGPDGRIWFTEHNRGRIGRITTAGTFLAAFKLPNLNNQPDQITAGPDGNLWVTQTGVSAIDRVTPTGTITEFPTGVLGSSPRGITPGSDGNLWFTDYGTNSVGRITTSGTITEFPVPTPDAGLDDIAPGPDGNLWFAETGTSQIGQVSTSGVTLSETPVPTAHSQPFGVWPGPDGNIWFTEQTGRIGRLALPHFNLLNVYYIPNRFFIPNIAKVAHRGDTVRWLMLAAGRRGVMDTTGLNLYGITPAGGPIATPIGGVVSYAFDWAGTFPYDDPFHTASQGKVSVPISVARAVGAQETASVNWAATAPPAGDVFDVQVEVPGSSRFVPWQTTTALGGGFGPTDALWAGPGSYRFRSRLADPGPVQHASGYSAAKAITLS
jgi:streptogramin lyase